MNELRTILKRWMRWYKFRRAVLWGCRGLAVGAGAAIAFAAYAILTARVLPQEYLWGVALISLAGLLIGFLAGLFWPWDELRAARFFDVSFNLKERVSTAVELSALGNAAPGELRESQLQDALGSMGGVIPRKHLPLRFPRLEILLTLMLLAVSGLGWVYADDIFKLATQKREVAEAIEAQAAELEALIEEIQQNPALTEEQKDALLDPLLQALDEVSNAESLEEAVAALEEAKEDLRSLADPGAEALADNLQQAAEELAQEGGGPLEPFAEHLAEGNYEAAAQELENLDAESMEQAERERLAEQLEALADSLEATDPDLAQQLRDAAEAARNGDTQAAEQALQEAAQAIEEAGQQAAQSEAAEGAAQTLEESEQALAEAGGQPGVAQGEGQGEQGGQEGSGSEGGSGGGSGEGGEGEPPPGGEAGTDPISQGGPTDGSGESPFEPITPSSLPDDAAGWISVPPSGVQGENVVNEGSSDLGNTPGSNVPYTSVLPEYQRAAIEAINSGLIPPQYRDLIRDYFSSLEP